MVTANDCYKRWGDPSVNEAKFMVMWDVPAELEIGVIPKRIYCNKLMIGPLTQAFKNLISTGYVNELRTWNGDRKSTRLNSSHIPLSRMPSSA